MDRPQIRDLGFIVADGAGFWSEVKRDAVPGRSLRDPGIPAISVVHRHASYELALRICADNDADVVRIEALLADTRPPDDPASPSDSAAALPLLAPHLGFSGVHNRAWAGTYKGRPMLFAPSRTIVARARVRPGPVRHVRWLRGRVGRLAGLRRERPHDLDV